MSFDFNDLMGVIKVAGRDLARNCLALWFCMLDKDTPMHIRAIILAKLGYVVSPLDAIPDALPFIGLSDDISIIAATILLLALHIKQEHWEKADNVINKYSWRSS